jgi:lantibiotic leader peptide-processing serine protease
VPVGQLPEGKGNDMKRGTALFALAVAVLALGVAPGAASTTVRSYLIVANGNAPTAQQIHVAGGTLTRSLPQIGVAVASSSDPRFATKAGRLGTVVPNVPVQLRHPVQRVAFTPAATGDGNTGDDPLSPLQWGHDAVDAPQAWALGAQGAGTLVAVLDDGIDSTHPDLVPNFRADLSTSFIPGETYEYDSGIADDPFSHGTHVAGTIVAARNGFGVTGIAPSAQFFMVKVLASATGSGTWESVISGILHAADSGADVINMSLGASVPRRGYVEEDGTKVGANEIAALVTAIDRASAYAHRQGATVVAAAGNAATDRDKDKDQLFLPADSPHVIAVSALGPRGWALDPTGTDLDEQAFYTNYGRSAIDFSAPGGNIDFDLIDADPWEMCTVLVVRPCWVFDLVFSTGSAGSFYWGAGTSMAAPHVSGVAALVIASGGGSMHPAQVAAALRRSADDLGQPGRDPVHGLGRVNAARAAG